MLFDRKFIGDNTLSQLCSKQFATELHDQGYTQDDAIVAVCQVFGVPRREAWLFIVSHPAWAADSRAEEPEWSRLSPL